jgi:hypothetical protein
MHARVHHQPGPKEPQERTTRPGGTEGPRDLKPQKAEAGVFLSSSLRAVTRFLNAALERFGLMIAG